MVSPSRTGDVSDKAVEGRAGDGLVERIEVGALAGDRLVDVTTLRGGLGERLRECGLALGEGGDGAIVGGLLGVEVLLGDQLGVVKGFGAVEVELLLL